MSALVEIGELVRTRPCPDATVETLAAWYERKAVVLGRIASEATTAERDVYTGWADLAHCHAVRLAR